ncbi:MAG: FtsW/RodA/SpoVE family cell cycle protein [Lachnospiraceae bacterium]|jgi:rod shape determining protein RodA|nr:FtsW/RodA/SpoVE family cell cycle protein [Lachnospiraceae bacterium]MCI8995007.1 FtsW/RodA/SpoVE family cell cycle protein [Lachnospiraceae bacterium]MCI9134436.1 FtsW/RodA/SpoVE family cell cycle protein [Lachnospiraceae bacterium]
MFKRYELRNFRFRLLFYVYAITSIGVLLVGSAEKAYQSRQLMGMILGTAAMLVVALVDYTWVLKFYWLIYIFNIVQLLLVKIPILNVEILGKNVKGATRWIEFHGFQFQPSELSKLLLILFFARFFERFREQLNTWKILGLTAILAGVPLFIIVEQPDLSTTISVTVICLIVLYAAGLSYKIIGAAVAVAVPSIIIFLGIIFQPDQTLLDGYQLRRIMAWLQPMNPEYADDIYQQQNSIMAIGSGQLTGKGLNNNLVSSVKNGGFVAEPQTDFIFAIAGEELGFIGCATIILLLMLIVIECIWIGRRSREFSGTLICCGIAGYIGFQGFVNICVATGLMPNTGIPLPFVSYGMTSMVTLFLCIGFVLNVGLQPKKY